MTGVCGGRGGGGLPGSEAQTKKRVSESRKETVSVEHLLRADLRVPFHRLLPASFTTVVQQLLLFMKLFLLSVELRH